MGSQNDESLSFKTDILVVGGGPVGMFTALRLSQLGKACTIVEQNNYTTVHPKMEYTSHRTMEIYRRMGILDHVRSHAVPQTFGFREVFVTGIGPDNIEIARIDRPSPIDLSKAWATSNDGTHPVEPHMRQSQIVFESLLKPLVQKEQLIKDLWGYSFQSLVESDDGVVSTIRDASGGSLTITSRYVIGCDGAGSKVRSSANILSPRRSLPMSFAYAHFQSNDSGKILHHGDFWHMNIITGAVIVAQDEIDTYTMHRIFPPGVDYTIEDPVAFVKESVGGVAGPSDFEIQKVLIYGKWQAELSIADSFRSEKGRIFLAGDAAHQLTPVGGHGMNSGIQDGYDLAWKLAAVIDGWGGADLLDSYQKERRPVAELNTAMVEKATMEYLIPWVSKANQLGFETLIADTDEGKQARDELQKVLVIGHWMHEQNGTVMGYRYNGSPIVVPDPSSPEPANSITEYIPSTWPGARAPHVFLTDGKRSIFDLYGKDFSIVDFTSDGNLSKQFVSVAEEIGVPMTAVHIPAETHCRSLWERDVVLIRPDGFVAWRCPPGGAESVDSSEVTKALQIAAGRASAVES